MSLGTNKIIAAWNIPGPRPDLHRQAQLALKRDWPTLYDAIQILIREHNEYS